MKYPYTIIKNPFKNDTMVNAATKIGTNAYSNTVILSATIRLKKKKSTKYNTLVKSELRPTIGYTINVNKTLISRIKGTVTTKLTLTLLIG